MVDRLFSDAGPLTSMSPEIITIARPA